MNLESPKVRTQKSAEALYQFLVDIKGFEKLMPENHTKFEMIGDDAFIFGLKGMPEIKLILKEKVPFTKIVLGTDNDKFPFSLTAQITAITPTSSDVQLFFEGEFNTMMSMMIKGPINKFIETLVQNMTTLS